MIVLRHFFKHTDNSNESDNNFGYLNENCKKGTRYEISLIK
jgi:hypothetical protein